MLKLKFKKLGLFIVVFNSLNFLALNANAIEKTAKEKTLQINNQTTNTEKKSL